MTTDSTRPGKILASCRLSESPQIYCVGNFDERVTVLTQQRRALNLVWALIEGSLIPTAPNGDRCRIAIVGAGFSGLTVAAALLRKRCHCSISIFEERDTLLPLQQGSDTRWLHPHIYDWPAEGSEAVAAMMPVLNWTAARASDVVVQALRSWAEIAQPIPANNIKLWCNTRHLQIRDTPESSARLEWVGERRTPSTGQARQTARSAQGVSADFDIVILAVGFGLESLGSSYWRNEVFGQPGLQQRAATYLVSGQGDGAMIDLLRLKISQFRQDRILAELFGDKPELVKALRELRSRFYAETDISLYEAFDALGRSDRVVLSQFRAAIGDLGARLRRDTDVVLQVKPDVRSLAALFVKGKLKASFQNAFLVYLLYRCGGFTPASGHPDEVAARFGATDQTIIRRHGTDRLAQLARFLPTKVVQVLKDAWDKDRCFDYQQSAEIEWSGGYFGTPGRSDDYSKLKDAERAVARKEYLPGPTALFAAAVAGAVAGYLLALKPGTTHLRLTIHRVIRIHDEDLLQQCCAYVGTDPEKVATAGRTFPAEIATIGQAYQTRRTIRSAAGVSPAQLDRAMRILNLTTASRKMANTVRFVAALPVLQPERNHFAPSPVCAILYFDSRDEKFDLTEREFSDLGAVMLRAIEVARVASGGSLDRIDNTQLCPLRTSADPAPDIKGEVARQLKLVKAPPPSLDDAFVFNFDHSDLTPLIH